MRVLTMVSPKGGAGKTTMAMAFAGEIAHRGQNVCFVDADPNKPLSLWAAQGNKPENIHVITDEDKDGDTIYDSIDAAKERADWVIIDTEGSPNVRVTRTITEAGLCVIPIRASYLDSAQAARAVKLIKDASRQNRRKIPFVIAFTQVKAAIVTKTYKDIGQQIREQVLPVLPVELFEREPLVKMFAFGTTLYGLADSEVGGLPKALENASALTDALIEAFTEGAKTLEATAA
ncbi:MAG: ParA family protein [Alphaproteobacteria bacterium GM202ARS2]|nr:ParA family protein [Alphaproteobacteria bacterium GM202ARS2]